MRSFLGVGISLVLLGGGCAEVEVHACRTDRDCEADAVCVRGYCLFEPLPRLRVKLSSDRARVGEVVRLDASRSYVMGGGPIDLELFLDPEEAVERLPADGTMVRAFRIVQPHRNVEAVLVGRTASGREVHWKGVVAPRNSPPRIRFLLPERLQPGERIRIGLEVEDPDGDPVEVAWSHEGPSTLTPRGLEADLQIPEWAEETWHRIEARASDGLDVARASIGFQAKNAPPRILEVVGPPAVAHGCDATACVAQAAFRVDAEDAGRLQVRWRFLGAWPGEVEIRGEEDLHPVFHLRAPPTVRIAGSYPIEVEVRDVHGATATATAELTVGNRPPQLVAHDGSTVHHAVVGPNRYRWTRPAGAVAAWDDPDGDVPAEVLWSSPDPRVHFEDPHRLDTALWVEGDESLVGARIPLVLEARDVNGGTARAEGTMVLGNRPPEILSVNVAKSSLVVGESVIYKTTVTAEATDPDGDPVELWLAPEYKLLPGVVFGRIPGGAIVETATLPQYLPLVYTARDPLGGMTTLRYVLLRE
ncbi:MAG TPA: hypothetical protein VKY51_07365 [Fredinandcohnia sp.]|nr:hypothetical protein [Fredinandcohnia sp.]